MSDLSDQIMALTMSAIRSGTIGSADVSHAQVKKALAKASKMKPEELNDALEDETPPAPPVSPVSPVPPVPRTLIKRKFGTRQEVYEGLAIMTRGNLHKSDLTKVDDRGVTKYVSNRPTAKFNSPPGL
jgi:hypothetical protein